LAAWERGSIVSSWNQFKQFGLVCAGLGNSPFRVEINEQLDILNGNNYVFKT
jgi:hypothetical protein